MLIFKTLIFLFSFPFLVALVLTIHRDLTTPKAGVPVTQYAQAFVPPANSGHPPTTTAGGSR